MHVRLRIAIAVMGVSRLVAEILLLREFITVRHFPLRRPMSTGGDSGAPYTAPTRDGPDDHGRSLDLLHLNPYKVNRSQLKPPQDPGIERTSDA